DLSWGVVFPGGGPLPRHPSQLYEAVLEGGVMFVILRLVARRRLPDGTVFWTFIALYGLFRCCIEFFREPDQQLGFLVGWVTMGQLLSLPMLVVGGGMALRLMLRRPGR
ncbi:MAG TPA: prolipoprotein diacylglyceryl transferase family protein, partial [Geobacteraceae bacterium]